MSERARKLFAGPIDFLKSAPELQHLPEPSVPEIAFAGRSNVGKSTALNKLLNRKAMARVSRTPGRTQLVNLFKVGEAVVFADLPGYGFAKVPAAVRVSSVTKLIVAGRLNPSQKKTSF